MLERVIEYRFNNSDSALALAKKALLIARRIKNDTLIAHCLNAAGGAHYYAGNLALAMVEYKEAAKLANRAHYTGLEIYANHNFGLIYLDTENFIKAAKLFHKNILLLNRINPNEELLPVSYYSLGTSFEHQSKLDSANFYFEKALQQSKGLSPFAINNCYFKLAKINYLSHNDSIATRYMDSIQSNRIPAVTQSLIYELKAQIGYDQNKLIDARRFGLMAIKLAERANYNRVKYTVYKTYSTILERLKETDSAFYYLKRAVEGKEKHQQQLSSNQLAIYENELRDEEIESKNELLLYQSIKIRYLVIIILLLSILLVGIIVSIRKLKNAKTKVELQRSEIQNQQEEIVAQNEELRSQQEEIVTINNRLEELLNERTTRLEVKKQQVTDYAFFNAHELRRPISTILGLQEVLRLTQDNFQRLEIITKLMDCVAELDVVVKKSQRLLDPD
jgi:tetratricopeptide (TPR) repeat protein